MVLLVTAFISSRFKYCNALLGATKQAFDKMQLVQNEFYQELKGSQKDFMAALIQPSIDLKIRLIVCKALNSASPAYISDVLTENTPDMVK